MTSIARWSQAELAQRRRQKLTRGVLLHHLRSSLGWPTGVGRDQASLNALEPELPVDLLGSILLQAPALVHAWHGTLYFIYLPELARYASPESANKDRDRVLALVRTLEIPLIDMHVVFQAHRDPVSLFPFRRKIHYTEEGHRLVAAEVLRFVFPSN